MTKIKDRIDEINKLRKELDEEVESLKSACLHDEYHIGTSSWRIGAYRLII